MVAWWLCDEGEIWSSKMDSEAGGSWERGVEAGEGEEETSRGVESGEEKEGGGGAGSAMRR